MLKKIFSAISIILLTLAGPASAATDPTTAVIQSLTAKVVNKANLKGQSVIASPNDMYDAGIGKNLPFSEFLRDKVSTALKMHGVGIRSAASTEDRQWSIHLQWKIKGDDLYLTYIARLRNRLGPGKAISRSQKIPFAAIPAALFQSDLRSHARTLVRTLESKAGYETFSKVHLRPINAPRDTKDRELAKYFEKLIFPVLKESSLFHTIDPAQLYSMALPVLRTRGIRRVRKKPAATPNAGNSGAGDMSLAADMLDADSEISTDIKIVAGSVNVGAQLNDRTGKEISLASVDFPTELLPADLIAKVLAPNNKMKLSRHAGYSHKDLKVEVATTRGEGLAVYRKGQVIRFFVRLNKSAHVYLIDFDSAGRATLLYPESPAKDKVVAAGMPLVLPEDGLDYELRVDTPFGKDTVFVAASETPLKVAQTLLAGWGPPAKVRSMLRKLGEGTNKGYAEAEVDVETRK